MKVFVVLATVGLISLAIHSSNSAKLTKEEQAKVDVLLQECVKEENFNVNEMFMSHNYTSLSQKYKCFSTCFMEKIGIIKDGVVQDGVILDKLTPDYGEEKSRAAAKNCKDVKGSDRCDTGYKLMDCFEKSNIK